MSNNNINATQISPVAASISVPPAQRPAFDAGRDRLMELVRERTGKAMSFSKIIRKVFSDTTTIDSQGRLVISLD